jgi:GntR family transcriptional regulator
LAVEHQVARNTAREAIRLLSEEGLVTAQHGSGVYVRQKYRLMRFGSNRYSRRTRDETGLSPYRAEVAAQGRTAQVECTSVERVAPPADVAERLGNDADVVRRENWYYADGEPMQIGITFTPFALVDGSPIAHSTALGKGSLYARFDELGYRIARVREEISARMPSPDETRGLSIPDGVPVIEVLHTGIDEHDRPFEVTRFIMRADYMGLDYHMPVED